MNKKQLIMLCVFLGLIGLIAIVSSLYNYYAFKEFKDQINSKDVGINKQLGFIWIKIPSDFNASLDDVELYATAQQGNNTKMVVSK